MQSIPATSQQAAGQKEAILIDKKLVDADNRFGLRLFHELRQKDAGLNLFLSPMSITQALQMAYNGAAGQTQQAMAKAMGLQGQTLEAVNRANAVLLGSLARPDSGVTLSIANGLWVHTVDPIRPEFIQRAKEFYGAEIGDLAGAPGNVNAWVSRKTRGKIENLVQGSDLAGAVALLVNAVYFKGAWVDSFDPSLTKTEPFTLSNGRKAETPMMHASGEYAHYQGDHFQAVRLPYAQGPHNPAHAQGRIAMYLFLPDENTPLPTFLKTLTPENWNSWLTKFTWKQGDLALPRFRFEYSADLNDTLQTLGMGIAFDPQRADFSSLLPERIWISKARHKTFVSVDEKGTEAAAATEIVLTRGVHMPPKERFRMVIDRPFFCAIRDDLTGAILFLGTVVDPKT
jgi:serpin B